MPARVKQIVPHLWFDTQAGEAAKFYVSIFPDSKINGGATIEGTPSGNTRTVTFELSGQPFMAISAGPYFTFNEAVSFMIVCDTQEDIEYYWRELTANGGQESQCGWLKDKFGLSWQVVPSAMNEMMTQGIKEQTNRVTKAFMQMKKLDIAALQKAFDNE